MFTSQITSNLFLHDAETIKNAILSADDKTTVNAIAARLWSFRAEYESMEDTGLEEYEVYHQTVTYLEQLLENKQDYFRY